MLRKNFHYSDSLNFHVSGSTQSVSKEPTQLIIELNSSLRLIIVTLTLGVVKNWFGIIVTKKR